MPITHLRVLGILDLQPRRGAAIGAIRAVCPRRDDAFKVTLARHAKQVTATALDVVKLEQPTLHGGHDAGQSALALKQRQPGQILAFDAQHIERIEERPLATE